MPISDRKYAYTFKIKVGEKNAGWVYKGICPAKTHHHKITHLMLNFLQAIILDATVAILLTGQRLLDALQSIGENAIPDNSIIDKTETGIGATYLELHKTTRPSIIIEPTVPVIRDKTFNKDKFLAVYEDCKWQDVVKYLKRTDIKWKKLLTTPESFWKIKKACTELNIDMYDTFFCLFDECEKLTQDSGYRKKITQPIKDFFLFRRKAMVSATPLLPVYDPRFKNFRLIKVKPQYDYRKNLTLIVTNNYEGTIRNILLNNYTDNYPVFIFYNTTDGIDGLINTLGIKEESKVFCSRDSMKKLKKRGFMNVSDHFSHPLAKYNFLTCRFYSALDIVLKENEKPDMLLLTNLFQAEHSIIDPYSEAIQAQGRFRKLFPDGTRFRSLTHITNIRNTLPVKSDEELDIEIEEFLKTYESLKDRLQEATTEIQRNAILKEMGKVNFAEFIDGDGDIDYFAIRNRYNRERVRRLYLSGEALRQGYEATGHFNVNYQHIFQPGGEDDRFEISKVATFADRCKLMLARLDELKNLKQSDSNFDFDSYAAIFKEVKDGELIVEAYSKLGWEVFEENKYRRADIKKALEKYNTVALRFSPEVLLEIQATFPLNVKIEQDKIQEDLQTIYKRYGIEYTVKKVTIKDYYDASPSYSQKPYTHTLHALNPGLVRKSHYGDIGAIIDRTFTNE